MVRPKRLIAALLILVACGTAKHTTTYPQKCVNSGFVWRYSHTNRWTTEEAVYEYHYDWQSGEWEYGYNGTETVHHSEDIFTCQERQ